MMSKSVLTCLAFLMPVLVGTPTTAQSLEKVKAVIPQNSVFVLNWMGARDAGVFRKHGIDLEVDARPFAGFLAGMPSKECMSATYSGIDAILKMNQDDPKAENPYRLQHELGETMLRDCTIERHNAQIEKVLAKIGELDERAKKIKCTDSSPRSNQGAQFVRHFQNMLVLARVIAQGAKNRDESRGAHFKPEFKQRDDANWLRTTMALYRQDGARSKVEYVRSLEYNLAGKRVRVTDDVDISLVKPRARRYEQAGAASATAADAGPRSQKAKSVNPPPAE